MTINSEQFEQLSDFHEKVIDYKDLFLPPTLITLTSLGLVLDGSRKIDTVAGMNQIVLGRTGDLFDGLIARVLDQSTDLGALTDTAADKLGMLAIGAAAWQKDAVPKHVLATIGLKQTSSVALTGITAFRHPEEGFRPTKSGKYAMLADNIAVISYGYANALEKEQPEMNLHNGARLLGKLAFNAGCILGTSATATYADRAFRK